jgi:hypothetical protein
MPTFMKIKLAMYAAVNTVFAAIGASLAARVLRYPVERLQPFSLALGVMAFSVFVVWAFAILWVTAAYCRQSRENIQVASALGAQSMLALIGLMMAFLVISAKL